MPQVVIQPGLGESINRYLERLGRRGEEQRRLQAQHDALQAQMEFRQSEARTRMISDSISQGIGLYTDEKIRDRASERRVDEAEEIQYLRGKPARQEAGAAFGMTTLWQGGALEQLNKELGIPTLLSRAHARINASPNTLSHSEVQLRSTAEAELQTFAKGYLEEKLTGKNQEHYVRGTLKAIEVLNNIHPSGPPKSTIPLGNVVLGSGRKSENNPSGNGIPLGLRVQWNAKSQRFEDMPGEEERQQRNEDLWTESLSLDNPAYTRWLKMSKEEQANTPEPSDRLTDEERRGWVLRERDLRMQTLQAANRDADDRNIAEGQLSYAALADPAATGQAPSFGSESQEALDARVKASGPISLTDERGRLVIVKNKAGQDSYATYMGNGVVELTPLFDPAPRDPASIDSLIRP